MNSSNEFSDNAKVFVIVDSFYNFTFSINYINYILEGNRMRLDVNLMNKG